MEIAIVKENEARFKFTCASLLLEGDLLYKWDS